VIKSLEDFRIRLERVAMAAQWTSDQKQGCEVQGVALAKNSLELTDQALVKTKEQEAAKHTKNTLAWTGS
jgi:hypothetical protein